MMARGFESKSVESQQEEAQRAKQMKPALSAEEQARQSRKTGLELALAQTQSEMSAACRPAHREMLKLRLEAIQAQIRDL
jgi:flagellar biosynthesis/type III secretory pathway protein FliH